MILSANVVKTELGVRTNTTTTKHYENKKKTSFLGKVFRGTGLLDIEVPLCRLRTAHAIIVNVFNLPLNKKKQNTMTSKHILSFNCCKFPCENE